jgi:hypothetical protein
MRNELGFPTLVLLKIPRPITLLLLKAMLVLSATIVTTRIVVDIQVLVEVEVVGGGVMDIQYQSCTVRRHVEPTAGFHAMKSSAVMPYYVARKEQVSPGLTQ